MSLQNNDVMEKPTRDEQISLVVEKLMKGEDHLSFSSLKCFKNSPRDFIDYKLGDKVTTDAMAYGSLVHCLVLEPESFEERYAVIDDMDVCMEIGGAKPRATKAYKEWFSRFEAENKGKTIISHDDYKRADFAAMSVRTNRASAKVLKMATEREKGVEWKYINFKFKGFIDGIGDKAVFDLKTCQDASPDKFQRDIIRNGYYLQSAMYLTAIDKILPYYIIAVDKNGGVSVHQLNNHLIEYGMEEYERLVNDFNKCVLFDGFSQSFDFFSERHDGIFVADKPSYLY